MLLGAAGAQAQTGTIAGTVTDAETGDTLPGANIRIENTDTGASTNAEGQYEITGVEPGTYRFRVSFVGFQAKVVEDVTVYPARGRLDLRRLLHGAPPPRGWPQRHDGR
jgi:hypothetical protein